MRITVLLGFLFVVSSFFSVGRCAGIVVTYPSLEYDGTAKDVSVQYPSPDAGSDVVTISYYLTGNTLELPSAPKNVGVYDVKVVVAGTNFSGDTTETFTVLPHPLDALIDIEVSSVSKSYDATIVAELPILKINGLLGGDVLSVASATATYDTKFQGTSKVVTVSGIVFSDMLVAANYTWAASYTNSSSSILPLGLSNEIYIGVANASKIYDGTILIDVPALTVHGLLGADVLIANGGSGKAEYDTKNAGTGKTITVSGFTFNDEILASCYTWSASYINTSSTILPRPLGAGQSIELASQTKRYDGTTTIDNPVLTITGLVAGDNFVAVTTNATTTFDTKNVGSGKTVTIKGFSFSDEALAANYFWKTSYTNTNGSITQRPYDANIYIVVADTTKVYDGNADIAVPSLTVMGLLGGDKFTAVRTSATASVNDPNVGVDRVLTVSSFTFSDDILAANYTWQPTYQNFASVILPMPVIVTADPDQKVDLANPEKVITYTTTPSILPNGELLNGKLTREAGIEQGIYNILQGTVTDSNNPNYQITFVPNTISLSVKELSAISKNEIYPNPAKNTINLINAEGVVSVKIFNGAGQSVWSGIAADFPLKISAWEKGTYLVCFEEKGYSNTRKLVVE